MDYQAILYETRGHVAILTLNRPERLNAISPELRNEVHEAVREAHAEPGASADAIVGALNVQHLAQAQERQQLGIEGAGLLEVAGGDEGVRDAVDFHAEPPVAVT